MKTSLSLLVCLAALPLLVPAQTAPGTVPEASGGNGATNRLFEPLPTPALTLRTPESSPTSNSLSDYTTWAGPKNEVLIENRVPQVTLGIRNIPVSGLLVDFFRVVPDSQDKPNPLERMLGRRNNVVYAEARDRKLKWSDDYLKWGARAEPWSVVSAAPPLQPGSVLFQTHH